jgi:hypothetical protein
VIPLTLSLSPFGGEGIEDRDLLSLGRRRKVRGSENSLSFGEGEGQGEGGATTQ